MSLSDLDAVLPLSLREVRRLIGEEAMRALALEMPGQVIFLPRRVEGTRLAEVVGEEAARRLAEGYSSEFLEVPLAKQARALWLKERGYKDAEIVARVGVSRQTLYKYWRGEGRFPAAIRDLFDGA